MLSSWWLSCLLLRLFTCWNSLESWILKGSALYPRPGCAADSGDEKDNRAVQVQKWEMCFCGQSNLLLVRAWECWEEGFLGPCEHFKGGWALSWEGMLMMQNFYWLMRSPWCNQVIKWQMQFFVGKRGVMYMRTERSLGPHVMCTTVGSALADQCHSPMSCCNYNWWFCVNINSVLSACWGKGVLGITRKEAQTGYINPWPTCTLCTV